MATKRTVQFEFKSNAHTLVDQLQKADKGVSGIQDKLSGLSKNMTNVGKNLTKNVTLPLLAVATASTKVGMDFETSFAKASTLIDTTAVDMKSLRDQILSLSGETGIAATELNEGLYQALSAGVPITGDASDAVAFMTKNVKLAKAGFTDTETAVDTTTSVLNAYKMEVSEVDKVSEILIKTQNAGKTTIGELGATISKVTPTASAMGVSFEQVGASLASLTAQGVPTAQATTQLNALMAELGKQGTQASKGLEEAQKRAGMAPMSFTEMMNAGYNLADVLSLMDDEAKANDASLLDMFGSIEAGKGALAIASDAQNFNDILLDMTDGAGQLDDAYSKVSDTTQERMTKAFNQLKNAGIELFESLAPIVEKLALGVSKLAGWFSGLDENTRGIIVAIGLFLAVLGPVISVVGFVIGKIAFLIGVFKKLKIAFMVLKALLLANPFILIIAGIIAVIALIWKFRDQILQVFQAVWKAITNVLAKIWEAIRSFFAPILDFIKNMVMQFINLFMLPYKILWNVFLLIVALVAMFLEMIWNIISPFVMKAIEIFQTIWNSIMLGLEFIKNLFLTAFTWIYETVIAPLIGFFTGVFNAIWGVISTVIDKIKQGFIGARDFIVNIFNKVRDTIRKLFSTVAGIIKAPINGIISRVNSVIVGNLNKIKVPDWVPGLGGKGINFPKIPQLAEGGVVDSATQAIIGEGADPEAIVPLNERGISRFLGGLNIQPDNKSGTSAGTTVNVTVPQAKMVVMDANYNKIGSIVMPKIVQKLKAGGAR